MSDVAGFKGHLFVWQYWTLGWTIATGIFRRISTWAISKSFVPGEPKEYRRASVFSHATHVAGMIGAADSKFLRFTDFLGGKIVT